MLENDQVKERASWKVTGPPMPKRRRETLAAVSEQEKASFEAEEEAKNLARARKAEEEATRQ